MDPSVLLKQRSVQWSDPLDDYSKLQTLRQMMDQRRIREQQYQLQQQTMQEHARKAQYEQEDRTRQMNLREFLSQNPNAGFSDIARFDLPTAIKLDTEQRQREAAKSTAAKAALDLQGERAKREANTYAAVTALPQDQQQDWWDTNVGGGLPVDRPPTALEEQAKYAEAYGGKALQDRTLARDRDIRETEKYRLEVAKLLPEVTTAQNKAAGTEPPTGELAYFKNTYLPAWREARKAPQNGATEIAAYEDFKKAGVQPQLLPADVEAQRVRMTQEAADARAAAAAANAAQKPPTQGEEVLAGYAARVKQANKGFEKVTMGTGERAWNNLTPTWLNTDAGQVFAQDERNFINSILRRESGAVISPSEFSEARAQYIPQPRDSDAVLEKKRQNRVIVQQNMIRGSGKAYVDPDELLKQAGGTPATVTPNAPAGVPKVGESFNGKKVTKVTKVK